MDEFRVVSSPVLSQKQSKTAVLVIDLQRDFLADDARLPIDRGQVVGVIRAGNAVIDAARDRGVLVAYIGNEFPATDWIANLFRRGASVRGSLGAELDARVHRVSDVYFPKKSGDAFTNAKLNPHLLQGSVDHLVVLGVFAGGCVRSTVLGARRRGYSVTVVSDGVGDKSMVARDKALSKLARGGAAIVAADAVVRSL